eukprot:gene10657-2771_t
MASAADPYFVVKEEVSSSIESTESTFQRWKYLYSSRKSDDQEFIHATEKISKSLKSITWDLEDLEKTVKIVEENPAKFNLDVSEIETRKAFVRQAKKRMEAVQDGISPEKLQKKREKDERDALVGRSKYSRYEKLEKQIESENQGFIENEYQTQQMVMREQDTQLSEVSQTIGVLKNMGVMIGDELDDHHEMLEEMDEEMNTTSDRLKGTLKKLDRTLAISRGL